jgi:LysM repeat protein
MMQRSSLVTQALIVSVALNLGFLATFVTFALNKGPDPGSFEHPPAPSKNASVTNADAFTALSRLPFQELLTRLESTQPLEEGFTERDLALACLVSRHHFHLDRALGGIPLQKRTVTLASEMVTLIPGLADYHFDAIVRYAKTEKWPFTSEGLFKAVQRARDPSLLEAFFLTPEFHAVATLFWKSGLPLDRIALVDLIIEGEWEMLQLFAEQQKRALDLTPERRRALLYAYFNAGSKTAARFLVEHECAFVVRKLSDPQVLSLLDLPEEQAPGTLALAKELLLSPRSDAVLHRAAALLYAHSQEPAPVPYDHRAALSRFLPEAVTPMPSPPPKRKRSHVVQKGDNLWKIARRYHVSVDALMQANRLSSDRLRPGRELIIPDPRPQGATGGT